MGWEEEETANGDPQQEEECLQASLFIAEPS